VHRIAVPSKGDYIHGSFIRPPGANGSFQVHDPGNLDHLVGTFPYTAASVDSAVEYARDALDGWRELTLEARVHHLEAVADQLLQVTDQLAARVTTEVGKPRWESRMEVLAAVRQCEILFREGPELLAPRQIESIGGCSRRRPLGVVAAIAPAPLPVFVPMGYVLSALLAGNTVVFNPSSRTPATGQLLAEVFDRSDLPRGVFNMIQGPGHPIGENLAAHPDVDAVVVAGHRRTARQIVAHAGGHVRKRIISQTGGKGTAVVLDDANLDRAVYEVVTGAFLTAGQRFNSTARVVVEDAAYEGFREQLLALSSSLRIGHGFDEDVFMGPVLTEALRGEILERVCEMHGKGAALPLAGAAVDRPLRGHYLTPSVLEYDNGASNGAIPEEVPGPVLALERSGSREETWEAADRSTYGLCAAVFTNSRANFEDAKQRIHVGTLNWNRATVVASGRLPISSWGLAGKGSEGNIYLLRALSHPMSALARPDAPFDPSRLMPGVVWPAGD
jgi:acyl-CoA reductase-like NAD-dependent aldehyde dehydrogenase